MVHSHWVSNRKWSFEKTFFIRFDMDNFNCLKKKSWKKNFSIDLMELHINPSMAVWIMMKNEFKQRRFFKRIFKQKMFSGEFSSRTFFGWILEQKIFNLFTIRWFFNQNNPRWKPFFSNKSEACVYISIENLAYAYLAPILCQSNHVCVFVRFSYFHQIHKVNLLEIDMNFSFVIIVVGVWIECCWCLDRILLVFIWISCCGTRARFWYIHETPTHMTKAYERAEICI